MTDSSLAPPQRPRAPTKRSFASIRAITALMLREMSTSYGRSPGGYLWAILEPVAGIALLSLVFSAAFRGPALGISFPMFYATGMLPFTMFNDVQNKVALSLVYSRPLLAYPTVTFLDAMIARFILNVMTQLMVSYLVLAICMMLFETRVNLDLPVIIEAFGLAAALALGVGLLNSYLFTKFSLMQRAWSIVMRPMFLISGVFLLFESVPEPYSNWLWYNPLIHVIGLARRGFYDTYDAAYVSQAYVLGVALVCAALGLLLVWREHRELLNNA